MTPIIPPSLIQEIIDVDNKTGSNTEKELAMRNAAQKAQSFTKDIMQSYVARGQGSHNSFVVWVKG